MGGLVLLVLATVASGGFVAGLDAGLVYNSFPLMDGRLVPADYGLLAPWHLNLFENPAAVQFNHRVLAMATLAATTLLWLRARRLALGAAARRAADLTLAMAAAQLSLGIATLLLVVPVWLGALHQAGAVALLSLALWTWHRLRSSAA